MRVRVRKDTRDGLFVFIFVSACVSAWMRETDESIFREKVCVCRCPEEMHGIRGCVFMCLISEGISRWASPLSLFASWNSFF